MKNENSNKSDKFIQKNPYQSHQNSLMSDEQPQEVFTQSMSSNSDDDKNYCQQRQYYPPQLKISIQENSVAAQENSVAIQENDPNQVKITFSMPEKIYCTVNKTSNKHHKDKEVRLSQTENALKQIQNKLNLTFSNFKLIGSINLLSKISFENHVIQPIMQNNPNFENQQIRQSKVVKCCYALQKEIKKYSFILLTQLFISSCLISYGNINYQTDENYNIGLIIPYSIHNIIQIILLLLAFMGLLRCIPRVLAIGIIFSFISVIFGVILILFFSFLILYNKNMPISIDICISISIFNFILGLLSIGLYQAVQIRIKKLLIILKQFDSKILESCCD